MITRLFYAIGLVLVILGVLALFGVVVFASVSAIALIIVGVILMVVGYVLSTPG